MVVVRCGVGTVWQRCGYGGVAVWLRWRGYGGVVTVVWLRYGDRVDQYGCDVVVVWQCGGGGMAADGYGVAMGGRIVVVVWGMGCGGRL